MEGAASGGAAASGEGPCKGIAASGRGGGGRWTGASGVAWDGSSAASGRSAGAGAGVTFSDRSGVEEILQRAKPHGYGIRTLVHEVVQSELFQSK